MGPGLEVRVPGEGREVAQVATRCGNGEGAQERGRGQVERRPAQGAVDGQARAEQGPLDR